jgi:hypothetical protein
MGKLSLAFKVLFSGDLAKRVQSLLEEGAPALTAPVQADAAPKPEVPERSDAVTLLATLQRDARLVDFIMEPLDEYSDAQIGAAVRDVQRDSRTVLERLFALAAVVDQAEGSSVELTANDHCRVRRTGDGDLDQATKGQLVHHGWQVTQCELPKWTGSDEAQLIVAPAEVEIRR